MYDMVNASRVDDLQMYDVLNAVERVKLWVWMRFNAAKRIKHWARMCTVVDELKTHADVRRDERTRGDRKCAIC